MNGLQGKRILVTGADGFIGSHLVERLLDEGATVRAFCCYNSNGSFGWLDGVDASDRLGTLYARLGDVRDARTVREATDGVDLVFHLAALIAIPYSYEAPASFIDTNVHGTLNVLEAVRDCRVTRMVHTSTSEVYGTPRTVPISEDHPLRGQSPYSASKIGADHLCESFARSFDTPVVVLRPFNTFGPRQSARAVIPVILGQLLAGATKVKLGSLDPRRDFTYVDDTVDGFAKMADADLTPGTLIQLGTGTTVSIGELFALCCDAVGVQAQAVLDPLRVRPPASEVEVLLSDPTLAADLLGWKPTVSLPEGLLRTAEWHRARVLDAATAERYQR